MGPGRLASAGTIAGNWPLPIASDGAIARKSPLHLRNACGLVSPEGAVLRRFRPVTAPEAPEVVSAIEANLPAS
jgi:hypothetical protein